MPKRMQIKGLLQEMHMAARGGDFILLDDCIESVCDELNSLAASGQWLVISDAMVRLTKVQQYQDDFPDEAILHMAKKIPFSIRAIANMTERCDEVQVELANNLVRFQGYDTLSLSYIKHTINAWIARGIECSAVKVLTDFLSLQSVEDNNVDVFIVACKAAAKYRRSKVIDFLNSNDKLITSLGGDTKEASISDAVSFYKFGMYEFSSRLFNRTNQNLVALDLYKIREATGNPPLSNLIKGAWLYTEISRLGCAVAYSIAFEDVEVSDNLNKNSKLPRAIQYAIQALDEDKIKYNPVRAAMLIDNFLMDFESSELMCLDDIPQKIKSRSSLLKRNLISSDLEI